MSVQWGPCTGRSCTCPGTAAGKGTGVHLFPTAPSMSHGTATPHLTVFVWKMDVIVNVKTDKMVQNLVLPKPTMAESYWSYFFACTLGYQTDHLGASSCRWEHPKIAVVSTVGFAGMREGQHQVCTGNACRKQSSSGTAGENRACFYQEAEKHNKSLSVVLWACVLYCAIFP